MTAKLTLQEQRLLKHPPTEGTWLCEHRHKADLSDGSQVEKLSHVINKSSDEKCWLCTQPRPRRPKLLWPAYQAVLAKTASDRERDAGKEEEPVVKQRVRRVRRRTR